MNWFDIFLLVIFLLHILSGFSRGLAKMFFDIFGFLIIVILSLCGSRFFSNDLAAYINPEDIIPHHDLIMDLGIDLALEQAPRLVAGIIAFLVLFLLLSLVFKFFAGALRWVNRVPIIGFINRLGGALLGALVGAIFVYIIIAAVSLIPLHLFMDALENSRVVIFAGQYLTPTVELLKEAVINFYLDING
jgi:uncharacterized membrane protein required for colicin V production